MSFALPGTHGCTRDNSFFIASFSVTWRRFLGEQACDFSGFLTAVKYLPWDTLSYHSIISTLPSLLVLSNPPLSCLLQRVADKQSCPAGEEQRTSPVDSSVRATRKRQQGVPSRTLPTVVADAQGGERGGVRGYTQGPRPILLVTPAPKGDFFSGEEGAMFYRSLLLARVCAGDLGRVLRLGFGFVLLERRCD